VRACADEDVQKREEVTEDYRKLHTEQLHNLFVVPNIIWMTKPRMRWARHVARTGERRGPHRILLRKPEGKRRLQNRMRRCEDNIKTDPREIRCCGCTGLI
jgi:hypothetical protein